MHVTHTSSNPSLPPKWSTYNFFLVLVLLFIYSYSYLQDWYKYYRSLSCFVFGRETNK